MHSYDDPIGFISCRLAGYEIARISCEAQRPTNCRVNCLEKLNINLVDTSLPFV